MNAHTPAARVEIIDLPCVRSGLRRYLVAGREVVVGQAHSLETTVCEIGGLSREITGHYLNDTAALEAFHLYVDGNYASQAAEQAPGIRF